MAKRFCEENQTMYIITYEIPCLSLNSLKLIMHKLNSDREYIGMHQQINRSILRNQDIEPSYLQELTAFK